jgi:hypothetical protein
MLFFPWTMPSVDSVYSEYPRLKCLWILVDRFFKNYLADLPGRSWCCYPLNQQLKCLIDRLYSRLRDLITAHRENQNPGQKNGETGFTVVAIETIVLEARQ